MPLTIKFRKDREDTCSKVVKVLKQDRKSYYTVNGVMVEGFGIEPSKLLRPWPEWPNELGRLYQKIRRCLMQLEKQKHVKHERDGKKVGFRWIARTE